MAMVIVDGLISALLLAAVVAWWFPRLPGRRWLLLGAAAGAGILGVGAVLAYRWQAGVAVIAAVGFLLVLLGERFFPDVIRKTASYWLGGVLLTGLGAAAMLAFYWFPIVDLPEPTGPHKVGVRDFEVTDESRRGLYAFAPDESRRLSVRVWYPVDDTSGHSPIPYFSALEARTTASALGSVTPLGRHFFPYLRYSMTNSHRDAPIPDRFDDLPVVMFSPGYRGYKGQNTVLMEHLASHGYIAFALQHTYDSATTVFPNGDIAEMDPALIEMVNAHRESVAEHGYPQETIDVYSNPDLGQRRAAHQARNKLASSQRLVSFSAQIWVDDRVFLHDVLQRGDVPESVADVVAAGDYDSTGQMGMSFGGSAASAVCMVDRRCAAVVNMDGEDRHAITFNRSMPVPMLSYRTDTGFFVDQLSDGDEEGQSLVDFSYERHETAGLRPDLYRIWMPDVSHYMHSDYGIFLSRNRNPFTQSLFGLVDGAVANQINNEVVRGFLDKHLRRPAVGGDFPEAWLRKYSDFLANHDTAFIREWWRSENPQDRTLRVVFETPLGDFALALYPQRAPVEVTAFLAAVEAGSFNGVAVASGARSMRFGAPVGVVELPVSSEFVRSAKDAQADSWEGIGYEHGVVALDLAVDGPPDAKWLVNLGAPGRLRYGGIADALPEIEPRQAGDPVAFGRVLYGLRVLERIQHGSFDWHRTGTENGSVVIERASRAD